MSQDEAGSNALQGRGGNNTPTAQYMPFNSSTLLSLPVELHIWIVNLCDIPSKLALRMTNRHFRALIKPPTHAQLLEAEKTRWAEVRDLFSCMDCLRLRLRCKFADAMTKGPKGKRGKEPQKRFCLDCGLNPKLGTTRYSPGSEMKVGGTRFVICKDCRSYEIAGGSPGSGLCIECWTEDCDISIDNCDDFFDFENGDKFYEWYDPS